MSYKFGYCYPKLRSLEWRDWISMLSSTHFFSFSFESSLAVEFQLLFRFYLVGSLSIYTHPSFFLDGMKRAAPRLFAIVKTHRARLFSIFFFFSATTTAENSREKWRTDRRKKEKMNCVERDSSRRGASSPSLIIGPQPLGEEEENKKGKKKIIKRDKT